MGRFYYDKLCVRKFCLLLPGLYGHSGKYTQSISGRQSSAVVVADSAGNRSDGRVFVYDFSFYEIPYVTGDVIGSFSTIFESPSTSAGGASPGWGGVDPSDCSAFSYGDQDSTYRGLTTNSYRSGRQCLSLETGNNGDQYGYDGYAGSGVTADRIPTGLTYGTTFRVSAWMAEDQADPLTGPGYVKLHIEFLASDGSDIFDTESLSSVWAASITTNCASGNFVYYYQDYTVIPENIPNLSQVAKVRAVVVADSAGNRSDGRVFVDDFGLEQKLPALFEDTFSRPTLDTSKWGVGDWRLGERTMLGVQPILVNENGNTFATLSLETYYPSDPGAYLYGSEIYSVTQFQRGAGLDLEARVRVWTETPGIVDSFFTYGSINFQDSAKKS